MTVRAIRHGCIDNDDLGLRVCVREMVAGNHFGLCLFMVWSVKATPSVRPQPICQIHQSDIFALRPTCPLGSHTERRDHVLRVAMRQRSKQAGTIDTQRGFSGIRRRRVLEHINELGWPGDS